MGESVRDWHVNVNGNVIAGQERRTVIEAFGKLLHPCWFPGGRTVLCLDLQFCPALDFTSLLLRHVEGVSL